MKLRDLNRQRIMEKTVQGEILRYLNTIGKAYRLTAQRRGSPDIVASYKGLFVAFEVKRDGRSATKGFQLHEAAELIKTKAFVFFVVSLEETKTALKVIDSIQSKDFESAFNYAKNFSLIQPIYTELAKVDCVFE